MPHPAAWCCVAAGLAGLLQRLRATSSATWLRLSLGPGWLSAVASALPRFRGRVHLRLENGWANRPFSAEAVAGLGLLFDCLPSPQYDLVPVWPGGHPHAPRGRQIVCSGPDRPLARPAVGNPPGTLQYPGVAVGGTFDRLHSGHRLLLACAALCCTDRLYIGVTGDLLLKGKKNAELLEPLERRAAAAVAYVRAVKPGLQVEVSTLRDPKAPPKAASMAEITALVISRETRAGGERVRTMRREQCGVEAPLALVLVDLVGAESQEPDAAKLSSSKLRQLCAENK